LVDPGLGGRVVLVTGGNHGIGAATVEALRAQGSKVFVAYLRDYLLNRVEGEAFTRPRQQTPDGPSFECDLADPSTIPALFERVEAELGPVEILVHNAAASEHDSYETITAELIDHHFDVNARATALLIAEFAKRHRARGATWGRIVTITSAGPDGFPGEISYGASKAALESYTYSAARELRGSGITANVVYPPPTDTGWVTDEIRSKVDRVGHPDEVAEVILFLCSEQARHVTGERIRMR
jgi:3-oxoacyl-[acyl-carrier protein] reductase